VRGGKNVISNLTSGLGNQLFQYAFGRQVAEHHGARLALNTGWYDHFQRHRPKREERLRRLGVPGTEEAFRGWRRWLVAAASLGSPRFRRMIQSVVAPVVQVRFFNENIRFQMLEKLPEVNANPLVLSGYWQSAGPAMALGPTMHAEVLGKWKWSAGAQRFLEQIRSCGNACFVHVRRGDYAQFGDGLLPAGYFRVAGERIRSQMGTGVTWFVFSEDWEWCETELKFFEGAKFVRYESADTDIEDMLLMAECTAGIMANSSFSWWGAALGNARRPICCPQYWLGREGSDYPDLRFPDWHVVEGF